MIGLIIWFCIYMLALHSVYNERIRKGVLKPYMIAYMDVQNVTNALREEMSMKE